MILFFRRPLNAKRSSENLFCSDRIKSDVDLYGRFLEKRIAEKIKRYKDEEDIFDMDGIE